MKKDKRQSLAPVRCSALLADTPGNAMQAELLRRAIRRTDVNILRILTELEGMRSRQRNRQSELARMVSVNEKVSEAGFRWTGRDQ